MSFIDRIHGAYVFDRRVRVLSGNLATLLPPGARVLDVGCGDGLIARRILDQRPDLDLRGVDVLVRPQTHIPVERFDGRALPCEDRAVDAVMFVDVLHHTDDPMVLLREARRVARRAIVIKDHIADGPLDAAVLGFMDRVGNQRHGVALPYNYWPSTRWRAAFADLACPVRSWQDRLGLYPPPAGWLFDRKLHFIARLDVG
jgi:SAM-dependent methyltransferase